MSHARRARVLIAVALLFAAALVLNVRSGGPQAAGERKGESVRSPGGGTNRAPLPSRAQFLRLLAAAEPEAVAHRARDDYDHPHPITRDHERLYRDADLLRAADEAIKVGEYDRARALLAQHHRELVGMSAIEEEGLWLLANCAEHGRADDVERVRSFYEEHTDSTVRRRLRRACLEREGIR